jgi:pimeloyl-ACP methyl ester carboxylesterase
VVQLRAHVVSMGDSRLEVWDRGTGASLLFIHGVATSGQMWAADLGELATGLRVIVYNRRGYGASSSSPRSWAAHADDTIALIEKLNAAPAVVVGYSAGAIVALDVALRRPELMAHLVLLDPAFNLKRCLTPGLLATLAAVKLLRRLRGDRAAAEHWLRYVSSYATGGSAFQAASEARREQLLANSPGIFADLASGGGAVDESRLGDIRVPLTIVEAALSPSFLRRSSHRLKQMLPQARSVTLERSGHWVALDAKQDLLAVLRHAAHLSAAPVDLRLPGSTRV